MSKNSVTKDDFIEWLAEHETAFEDFCSYFDLDIDDENFSDNIDLDETIYWLTDHETLSEDFVTHFAYMDADDVAHMTHESICDKIEELFNV